MIKPKKPSPLADDATLNEYKKAQSHYIEKMFDTVVRESKAKTTSEVVIYLCEKYHPDFKIKQTRGAKTKWGDYLKAMLAVEVEFRRKESGSTKKAIRDLIDDPIWQRMFSKSKDSVGLAKEIIKDGKKGIYYKIARFEYLESVNKGYAVWSKEVKKIIDEALFRK
ncbi:hypothetical protein [Polynucleobacter sp. UK-FUSCHL-C3]|uniref:Uncharacterized protein n=1 Tax=Polynucleobacter sp. UK-FUSCHL-C3 TaxID=2955208 RepID=A0AAU8A041_9BURK